MPCQFKVEQIPRMLVLRKQPFAPSNRPFVGSANGVGQGGISIQIFKEARL